MSATNITNDINSQTEQKLNNKKVSVLLLDDEFDVFKKLSEVFEDQEDFSVVGQASSCRIGTVMIQTYQPEIVVFNSNMTSISPEESPGIIRKILAQSEKTKVVAIVGSNDSGQIFRVIKAGAAGCLSIEDLGKDISLILEQVLDGNVVIPPKIATKFVGVLQQFYGPKPDDQPAEVIIKSLTTREKQLLLLMMKGYSYEQIAEICAITVSTVKTHFNAIFCKMGVKNRVQAIGIALRQDIQLLVEPDLLADLKDLSPVTNKISRVPAAVNQVL
ncbi:MAG: response regulator transcription factor [Candidatus Caenarcaniphilales bacterium]|nr:response regulator transcription factor [Candidatus Caenarcaniphilales bacterium]